MGYEYIRCSHEDTPEQVSGGYFAIQHIYWSGLLYFFFMARLFGRLRWPGAEGPLSTASSQRILLTIVIVCVVAGLFLTRKNNRSQWRLALNVLTPYGVYLVLKEAPQGPVYLWAAALICIGVTLLYAAVLLSAPVHDRRNRARVLKRRFHQLITMVWLLSRALLSLLAALSIAGALLGFSVIKPEQARTQAEGAELPGDVEPWREQLQGLEEERWAGLTLQEKTDLMQLVADIETDYLGLPDVLRVHSLDMSPSVLGFYSHEVRSVCISRDHLLYGPPEECLDTVLHEVYHSYQHYLCALYEETDNAYRSMLFLRQAEEYMDEFENYIHGQEDFMDYYMQTCEFDARDYAWVRIHEYQRILTSAQKEEQ